jgi:tyrosine-protein kinase Etk/Wzc
MSPEQKLDAAQGTPPVAAPPPGPQGELTLADYAAIIWRHRKLILACTAAGALVVLVALLILPKKYEATALLLPPQPEESSMSAAAAKLVGLVDDLPLDLPGGKSEAGRYVDMLGSERILDEIITKFEFAKRYERESKLDLRERLQKSSYFRTTKGGLIAITVRDRDPEIAARMANGFVEALEQLDSKLNIGKAGRERQFLDRRVAEAEKELKAIQEACRDFQQKHRLITVDEGLKATAMVMGELEAQRIAKEVELKVLTAVYAQGSPQLEILKSEVKQLGDKLKELSEKGVRGPGEDGTGPQWLFPRVDAVPALALEQMDLERRLRLHSELCRLLMTKREVAWINEAKERSAIQVVAPATAPDRPVRRNGLYKLVMGLLAGLAVGVTLVGMQEKAVFRFGARLASDKVSGLNAGFGK